ncbi:hypothetical protein HGA88_06780 [Candidatus Roizmanbacteria bacterium]|nr:hypothetical protein [Candidatus Roizmanbacteria bacterium]
MLKIYFTASTNESPYGKQYKKIIQLIKLHKAEVLSGEQIVNTALLKQDKQLSAEQIHEREKNLIAQADAVVAETTAPSLGVGAEIEYALSLNKPVLALLQIEHEDRLSPLISGNPSDTLFLEYYQEDNLRFVLGNFFTHVTKTKNRKGKLIVIDGGDGSGKTTQAQLLVEYLKKHKIPVKYMDFPQYYQSFHGKVVAQFLRGEFGNIHQVSPYLASLAYALDRASVKQEMEDFLNKGGYIIANRYATSNMAHQGAKFPHAKEREEYLKWVYELEYKVHKIPKEDLVIYLSVPWEIGAQLTDKKGDRKYLKGKTADIHETDTDHRQKAQEMYLKLAQENKHWITIDCVTKGKILPIEKIQEKILTILKKEELLNTSSTT